jgi:hypothetical protein
MSTKVGFIGTRHGMSEAQKEALRKLIARKRFSEFHHGDCVGSDEQAHSLIRQVGHSVKVVGHPAKWEKYRAHCDCEEELPSGTYNQRNKDIVDQTDFLIATPDSKERKGSGTWITIRYARKHGKRIYVVHKSGRITLDE